MNIYIYTLIYTHIDTYTYICIDIYKERGLTSDVSSSSSTASTTAGTASVVPPSSSADPPSTPAGVPCCSPSVEARAPPPVGAGPCCAAPPTGAEEFLRLEGPTEEAASKAMVAFGAFSLA